MKIYKKSMSCRKNDNAVSLLRGCVSGLQGKNDYTLAGKRQDTVAILDYPPLLVICKL